MASEIRPARMPKASDVLADDLRRLILGQRMPEGTPLPSESELVEELDLSRATVREALRLLEEDGLISVKRGPRGGIRVRHPDAEHAARSLTLLLGLTDASLGDLMEVRTMLEPAIAGLAAKHATAAQRAELAQLATRAEPVVEQIDFHVALGAASGNQVLASLAATLHELVRFHVVIEDLDANDLEHSVRAHVRIADAISAGDIEAATSAMRLHLESFEARMRAQSRLEEPLGPASRWNTHRRAASALAAAVRARAQAGKT
jgi:GntR family transcriptional repressor for pyruvate dehydrogenase complex